MAVNDKAGGPRLGQIVLYQISSTHVILPGIINRVNADGTVNICQCPAPASVTWIDRANVVYRTALSGATADDGCFSYLQFF